MDPIHDDSDAEFEKDGRLTGEIRYRPGDESTFKVADDDLFRSCSVKREQYLIK